PPLVSPTRLETWALCPFRYFLGDVLRVAEIEEPGEILVLSPVDRGQILHDALDQFFTEAGDRDRYDSWTPADRARMQEIGIATCERYEAMGRAGKPSLWAIERARILSELSEFLDAEEARRRELGTRFYAGEVAFGGTGPDAWD